MQTRALRTVSPLEPGGMGMSDVTIPTHATLFEREFAAIHAALNPIPVSDNRVPPEFAARVGK